jgi:hypothetical protein
MLSLFKQYYRRAREYEFDVPASTLLALMYSITDTLSPKKPDKSNGPSTVGHEALHDWFGLSYASWLTLPRSLMYVMPDDWQQRMAQLLNEFNESFTVEDPEKMFDVVLTTLDGEPLETTPDWLNYRHLDHAAINELRTKQE